MNTKIKMRLFSIMLSFVMLVGLIPTTAFALTTKLETPQNLKLQGTVLSWDAVDNADFYGVTLYHPNYQYSIGSWQIDGTSFNLYKYLKDGETYGATVIACGNGSYQISTPAQLPLTACTNAGVPIYRDVNVVNGTASVATAYPGMSVRLEAKPAPEGMVFDRWELSGGYINIGYNDTDTVIYVQAICDNDISARATYKYQEKVTSAFTVQPQGGAALVGESFGVTYEMNFTPQGTVKVQVEGNTPGSFTDLKQGAIDSASVKEDSVVTKTFRIMASDGTRNIYSDEFVVSWEDGPRFITQPVGGTVDHNVDFEVTYALNFTPFNCRVERYNDYLGQWVDLFNASATQATISSYDFNTTSNYRIKAIIEGGGEVYSDEFTVTWSDVVSKFLQHPAGGTLELGEDYSFDFTTNFTPTSNIAIQRYDAGWDDWKTISYCESMTAGSISGYATDTTHRYRLEAYDNGKAIHSNEFTVTWVSSQPTTYTVSFEANGGSGTMADVNNVSGDYTLPANKFTAPDGKKFKAWDVDGTEKAVGDKITVTANITIKAVWEEIPAEHTCEIKLVEKDEPGCTEGGKEAYYMCDGCGKFYEDENGAIQITDLEAWGNIPKLDHADADKDGKCDTCGENAGAYEENPTPTPAPTPDTGNDNPGNVTVTPAPDSYTIGGFVYKITSAEKKTVELCGTTNKKLKKLNVKATVTIDGAAYKVTSIGKAAFKNIKTLKTLTIGKNVTKIGNKAFFKCKGLKKIVIKAKKLKKVGAGAFKKTNKKMTVKAPKKMQKKYKKLIKK